MLRLRPCSSTASPRFAVKPKAGRRGIRRTETADPRKSKSPVWQRGFAEIGSSLIAVGRRRAKRRTVEWKGTLKKREPKQPPFYGLTLMLTSVDAHFAHAGDLWLEWRRNWRFLALPKRQRPIMTRGGPGFFPFSWTWTGKSGNRAICSPTCRLS